MSCNEGLTLAIFEIHGLHRRDVSAYRLIDSILRDFSVPHDDFALLPVHSPLLR